MNTMTSIIIPTHNALGLLSECVNAIRSHTGGRYEIIVVDNASADGTDRYCRDQGLRLVSLPVNAGFPAACNLGMQLACGDELLLLNNDVTVSPGWLDKLKRALYSEPDIGIVGPVTNYASGRQRVEDVPHQLEAFRRLPASPSDPSKWQVSPRLVGLCFLLRRELLHTVGFLDERFAPGHYEDDDYCLRARIAGYRLLIAGDCLVHHEGSAGFRALYRETLAELVDRNRRKFIEKWQTDPSLFM